MAIRSLQRGLKVLEALQNRPTSSLHEIHRETGISKPSLLRILETLVQSGLVFRRLYDGHYRISTNLSHLARKPDRYDAVAEASAPVLDRLCQKLAWPSDLMVPAGDHMEIRESSRVRTPFFTYFIHDRVGTPVNWVMSAVGRAYLAHCPEQERARILSRVRGSKLAENRLADDPVRLDRILAEVHSKGYATRDPAFVGGAYGRQTPDGLAAIAVPLVDRTRVHGVINLLWAKAARTVDDMAASHLADLQSAAREIVATLHAGRRKI
jgi:IclR family mhp operon transcriptional activator